MTVQPAHAPAPKRPYPAKNLEAITAVLVSPRVDAEVRDRFLAAYESALGQAREQVSIQPLRDLVEGWFPQAVLWSDPDDARAYLARIDGYMTKGIPSKPERRGREWLADLIESKRQAELRG